MQKIASFILTATISIILFGCSKIDNHRIPYSPVRVELDNDGLWNTYGVSGVGMYRKFIRDLGIPANFSYTTLTYTGYGGILLISDINNEPQAYDLACPVEASQNARVNINANLEAECPKCGSRYNVLEGYGTPIYGKAVELKYGLQRYNVYPATLGGYIIQR